MKIRILDTHNRADVRQFIDFPFDLYKGHPCWVPPVVKDMQFNLNREKHPTYRHAEVDFLVVESEGQTLGRLAVIHNHHHSQTLQRKAAFFYYFDVVEDAQAARALFDAAFDWTRRRGLNEITGPRGLLRFDGTGLLVKGYDYPALMGMAYNYPYYDAFVLDSGFEKVTDHYSGYIPTDFTLPEKVVQVAERVKERKGFWIKTFDSKKELWAWVPRLGEVYNRAFAGGRDFYPINPEELRVIASNLISVAVPRLIKFVMKDDTLIGFILGYPDLGPALQRVRGRLFPFGWLTLMRAQKTTRRLILNGIGLLPEYQGMGGTALLYAEMYKTGRPMGFEYAESVQVDEENFRSWSEHEHLKIVFHKAHRSYVKHLDA